MREFTTTTTDSIYSELPTNIYLDSLFIARGVSNDSKVILYYGGQRFAHTYRLYFTLDYLGLAENVFILDGGLKTWRNNELPVSADTVIVTAAEPGSLTIKANPSLIVNKEQVRSFIGQADIKIIDARRDNYYSGEKDGNGSYKRPGHIAGAKNITWLDIIDENQKLKSTEELQQYFIGQGINKEDKVITYCHIGLRASVLYTISKALGHTTKLYDGSINEWDRLDDSYPVENTYK
jgi:thiosulfate/3-mercaptopyruvate sulfurtransferase